MKHDYDAWYWKGDEMRLFKAGEEIPDSYRDHPTAFNGADPAAFDHDKDGQPGGSLPKRRGRPPKAVTNAV